jgi:hypothetical protein
MRRVLIALGALVILAGSAAAQAYPSGPVTMVIPFAAGGPTDVLGRIIGESMSKSLGQPVIIENVGGAGGVVGSSRVAKGKADGSQFVLGTVRGGAGAGRAEVQLALVGLGVGDEFLEIVGGQLLVGHEHQRHLGDQDDGIEVRGRIVLRLGIERLVLRMRADTLAAYCSTRWPASTRPMCPIAAPARQ